MVTWVELTTVKHGAPGQVPVTGVPPTLTDVTVKSALPPLLELKPVPVTVMVLPPAIGPAGGATPVTVGTGA